MIVPQSGQNIRMKGGIIKTYWMFCGLIAILSLSGCQAVENKHLAKLPFFEAKSDDVPGLDSPHQRKKLIQEKGKHGATANESEREILVAQLMYEYKTSPDPNMRRESVDALAKIPHPDRDRFLQEILRDESPFVRMSALEALGKTYNGSLEDLIGLLLSRAKTDSDRDVRLTAVRILGDVTPTHKNESRLSTNDVRLREAVVLELGDLLQDKIPAVRYMAMQSLHKITGKDYGNNIDRWTQHIRYVKNEVPNLPTERKLSEKIPTVSLPMFR